MTAHDRDDDGFTLIELLLSMSILVIIIGAVSAALITFLQNGTYASQRDDHSGGAGLLGSYLQRDLSSASTYTTTATACSGSGTSVLNLAWTEWTATPSNPSPAPTGGDYTASYVVTTDSIVPVGGATRYQLTRRLCKADSTVDSSLLLRNLDLTTAGAPATAVAIAASTTSSCTGTTLTLTLKAYLSDDSTQSYRYTGCIAGRTP